MLSSLENLPSLMCPITHVVFTEPVIGSDCHTYEKSAIVEWLRNHGTSPITSKPMTIDSLVLNVALKNTIEELSEMINAYKKSEDFISKIMRIVR
jgi:hypothetical protein